MSDAARIRLARPARILIRQGVACLLLLWLALLPVRPVHAAPSGLATDVSTQRALAGIAKEWQKTLDTGAADLLNPDIGDAALAGILGQLTALQAQARGVMMDAEPQAEVLRTDLDSLGEAPKEGEPPEAPTVGARRADLNKRLAVIEGSIKEADLAISRSDRMIAEIKALRRVRFAERLLTPGRSPLAPAIWRQAWSDWVTQLHQAYQASAEELAGKAETADGRMQLALPILGTILGLALSFPLRRAMLGRIAAVLIDCPEPSYLQRLAAAVGVGLIHTVIPAMAAFAVYLSLNAADLLSPVADEIARTVLLSILGVLLVSALCRSALAPGRPRWRVLEVDDAAAERISQAVIALSVVFATDRIVSEFGQQFNASIELTILQKFLVGLLVSLCLFRLLRRSPGRSSTPTSTQRWQSLRYPLAVLVAAIPVSSAAGYVALSRLLATQLVLTGGVIGVVLALRRVGTELIAQLLTDRTQPGRRMRARLGLSEDGAEMLEFWLGGAWVASIAALGLIALLLLWGVAPRDLTLWLRDVFFGLRIGGTTVSLAELILAVLLFVWLLAATRALQRTLDQRVFPKTTLDVGLRHSVRSAVGYAGFAVAAILAIATLGIDLSSLAIIAGALSVGIGFGLQNIFNNFISGLILLVERPIKVGDWVVVGDHQGYVNKISVRATEITTFDRASVFIPNSSLISGTVMNRTHADKIGRIQLPIVVVHGSDPELVRESLLAIAAQHTGVRRNPAPLVLFKGFSDSVLSFELVAFLHDVDNASRVSSDLFFAIHAEFKSAGIRIAARHQEIHVHVGEPTAR